MKKRCLIAALLLTAGMNIQALDVGARAPNVELPLLEAGAPGKPSGVNSYKGKLLYVDFFASWCGPCKVSLPILNDIRNKYKDKGFEVIAVNVDAKLSDALGFLKKHPVDYPVLIDSKGSMPKLYKVKGMPTAYLVDEKGLVIHKHTGFKKADAKKIESLIEAHLAGK